MASYKPSLAVLERRRDDHRVGGAGAVRASVCIAMLSEDADALYNSPVGIRAQFCLGSGDACSRELIDMWTPNAIALLPSDHIKAAEASLGGPQAKVCLDKDDIPNVEEIHIDYGPWIANLGKGERLAETGVLAPVVSAVWIKGGWVINGRLWADPVKADRSEKFRMFGFG